VVIHLRGFGPNQKERLETRVAERKDRLREVVRFVNEGRSEADLDIVYELAGR
jgi:hypothetical protein